MDTHTLLDEYKETKDCLYKGEHYSVRDNGAVLRHAQNPSKPRKLDNQWTFGKKNTTTGYMTIGNHRIHIIVATAFLGSHDSKKDVVDHIDTNRCNNRPDNLRWLTRLENALNNPATRKKITYLCGGDIQKFIDNPSCLRDLTGTNQDVMWMRTVSREEARNAYHRVIQWAQEKNTTPSAKGSMGEWIYTPAPAKYNALPEDVETQFDETDNLIKSLTPNAMQRNWNTPTEFPLCPSAPGNAPLYTYLDKLEKGAIVTKNKYSTHFIDDFALCNSNTLTIRAHADDGMKKYSTITITFENDTYVHEGRTFFEERGAQKALTLAQGLEWTGKDGIDDYC